MEPGRCPICGRTMDFSIEYYNGTPHVIYTCPTHGVPDYSTYATADLTNKCPICGQPMIKKTNYLNTVPNVWWECPTHGIPMKIYRYSSGTELGVLYQWYRGSKSGEALAMPYSYTVDYAHHETTTNPNTSSVTTITW